MTKDKGWAWVVAAATCVSNFCMIGFMKSFGLFFVEFLDLFQATTSATSVIFGAQGISFSIASLFVMTCLMERFTCRTLVMVGGSAFSAGIVLTSQASTLVEALLFIGLLSGSAQAFITGPCLIMVGRYFDRRYGIASGIAVCGGSFGQFILPPLFRFLMDTFSFRGAMLILGGLMLNCVVCGALLKPMPKDGKKRNKSMCAIKLQTNDENSLTATKASLCKPRNHNSNSKKEPPNTEENTATLLRKDESFDARKRDSEACFQCKETYSGKVDISEKENESEAFHNYVEKSAMADYPTKNCACPKTLKMFCSMWESPLFVINLISATFAYVGVVTMVVFIPPHGTEVGLSNKEIPLLLSVMGGCDLLGRILIGLLADTKVIERYRILSLGYLILGLTSLLTCLASNFGEFVAISVSYGIFGGLMYALLSVVVVDFFGMDNLPRSLGIIFLFQGSALCAANPFLGWLRDEFGRYDVTFYVIGSFLTIAGVVLFLVPLFRKRVVPKQGMNFEMTMESEPLRETPIHETT